MPDEISRTRQIGQVTPTGPTRDTLKRPRPKPGRPKPKSDQRKQTNDDGSSHRVDEYA